MRWGDLLGIALSALAQQRVRTILSILGVAMVSNDSRYVEGALSKLVDFVRAVPQVTLLDYRIEML